MSMPAMDDISLDLDCCRTCGHMRFLHYAPENAFEGQGVFQHEQSLRCDPQTDHGCDCKEYIPEDNLDYLEWRYNKTYASKSL